MKWSRQKGTSKQSVFLSHETKMLGSLTPLRDALEGAGFSVILLEAPIEKEIGYGIMEMIRSTDVLICAGDPERPWIKAETAFAKSVHVAVLYVKDKEEFSDLVLRVRDAMPSIRHPSKRLKWGVPIGISVSITAVLFQLFVLNTWSATLIAVGLLPWIARIGHRDVNRLELQVRSDRWNDRVADIWRDVDVNTRYEDEPPDVLGVDRAFAEVGYIFTGHVMPALIGALTTIFASMVFLVGVVVDCVRYYW